MAVGLTCHSALFSWKIIFEAGHRIYEVLVSACSAREEAVWRKQILDRASAESRDYHEYSSTNLDLFASMNSDVKPIGTIFGRPGTLARHQSLHRSGSDPKSDVANVIIKNTHALSEVICSHPSAPSLNRSVSVLSMNWVTIFSPKRSERTFIEAKLVDVWTKDILPFGLMNPGIRKRADPSNLIKRLSVVSLVSTVARKSMHSLQSYGSQSEASSMQSCESKENDDIIGTFGQKSMGSVKSRQLPTNTLSNSPIKRTSSLSRTFSFSTSARKSSNDWKSTWRRSASPVKNEKTRLSMTQEDVSVCESTLVGNITTDLELDSSKGCDCLKDISSTTLNDLSTPSGYPLKIKRKRRDNTSSPTPNSRGAFPKNIFARSSAR